MNQNTAEILFEKFEIIECLKKEPYTSVYFAKHIYLGKKIILKTLNTNDISDQTVLGRFKREAQILAQLDHPNLIKVLDFGMFAKFFYISFEYFESRSLREVMKQNNLSDNDKLNILVQLLKALNIAHQNKIFHRDIKPENILIGSDYHLKIADFGLALIQTDKNLTHDFSILGTPSYMSPEQLRGEKTLQTDIFSTGIVAYELYTGTNPFNGNTVSDTVNQILNYNEKSSTIELNKLPDTVRQAVHSMLRKSQKDRAKSVLEVLKLLGIEGDIYQQVDVVKTKKFIHKIYFLSFFAIIIVLAGSYLLFYKPFRDSINLNQSPTNIQLLVSDSSGYIFNQTENTGKTVDNTKPTPVENNNKTLPVNNTGKGKLFVECFPYADVYVDSKKIDTTPLKDYIELKSGRHTLKLIHPIFPPYEKLIFIRPNKIESIAINFNEIMGYLKCNIYPWGNVYINGELKGITPMLPIALLPGNYNLVIKNPKYEPYAEKIKINLNDTLNFNFNFEKLGDALKSELKTE